MSLGYARCPVCRKERRTTNTGRIKQHRKWDGKKMVACEGSLKPPAAK